LLLDDVDRATLYGRDGVVSYSTDAALIGRPTHDSDARCAALSGGLIKTVVEPEHVGDAEAHGAQAGRADLVRPPPAGTFVSSRDYRADCPVDPSHLRCPSLPSWKSLC
jgi:hypothetical protein